MSDKATQPATARWFKMPEDEPLQVVSILTIHEGRVCEAWQTEDDEWFAVAEGGVEAIHPEIYMPMPPRPTDEEIAQIMGGGQ